MSNDKFIPATLRERVRVTDELAIFRVATTEPFSFQPGQFATLGLQREDKLVERAYSIASAPEESLLEFFIEHVPEGRLTPSLFDLKVGDPLSVRRRFTGRFVLDVSSPARDVHLMCATVTGVAPFVSILRSHRFHLKDKTANTPTLKFLLIHGASRSPEFAHYLEELQTMHGAGEVDVEYVPTVSRYHEDEVWTGEVGRVEDVLRKYADKLPLAGERVAAYLCGNPHMIANARGVLLRSRVAPERIHEEKYY